MSSKTYSLALNRGRLSSPSICKNVVEQRFGYDGVGNCTAVYITISMKNQLNERFTMRDYFSSKFDEYVKVQIGLLNKANIRYCDDIEQLSKNQKYIGKNSFKLMQPLALKPFAEIIYKHLIKEVKPNQEGKYLMFTLVTGFNFGKDNWNNNYHKLQEITKKLLSGYDYLATVALDEFPRERYINDGILMSWHVHGIIFDKPSRWSIKKINDKVKRKGHKITPFKTSSYERLIDAIYYAFKGPFGGKVKITDKNGNISFRRVKLSLFSYYQNLMRLKNYPIYFGMFAGGKGEKVLDDILEEISNDKA